MYLASGRNIYIYSEMPTEVLCALLAHAVEVKGLNTGSTNFRSNSVVLLEYFLKCFFCRTIYLLVLTYLGHFHYVYPHVEGCVDGSFAEDGYMRFLPPAHS